MAGTQTVETGAAHDFLSKSCLRIESQLAANKHPHFAHPAEREEYLLQQYLPQETSRASY